MERSPEVAGATPRPRLEAIDLLRGLVMVIMALDHTRDFFSNANVDPLDLARTNPPLFFTRWITHFCAPVFMFLAGTSAFLSLSNGKTKRQLARFLLTRGLFLVLLELTIVHFGWYFNFDFRFELAQVIWALGWSMVALAGLVFLPTWAVAVFGVLMIAGHNLLDHVSSESFGALSWLWTILHSPGLLVPLPGTRLTILYPLIPWIGVMAAGYGIGPLLLREPRQRQRWLLGIGIFLMAAFVILRATNLYGDPLPWSTQKDTLFTLLSFVNTQKYPPSLLFLLMTLGPSLIALALFDRFSVVRMPGRPFIIFGRVPLFYYVLHLPLLHLIAILVAYAQNGDFQSAVTDFPGMPPGFGFDLPVVYLVWLAIVIVLFPVCRWYANFKQRRRNVLLSYL